MYPHLISIFHYISNKAFDFIEALQGVNALSKLLCQSSRPLIDDWRLFVTVSIFIYSDFSCCHSVNSELSLLFTWGYIWTYLHDCDCKGCSLIYLFSSCEYFSYGFKSIYNAKFPKMDLDRDLILISDLRFLQREKFSDGDIIFINYDGHNEALLLALMDVKLRVKEISIVILYHFNKMYTFIEEMVFFNITKFIISSLNCICSIHTIINSYYHSNEVSVFIFKKSKVILKVDTSLNDNEKRVITYILLGLNNKKISKKLNISNKTVSYYRCSICKKLKINNLSCLFIRFNRHSELLID